MLYSCSLSKSAKVCQRFSPEENARAEGANGATTIVTWRPRGRKFATSRQIFVRGDTEPRSLLARARGPPGHSFEVLRPPVHQIPRLLREFDSTGGAKQSARARKGVGAFAHNIALLISLHSGSNDQPKLCAMSSATDWHCPPWQTRIFPGATARLTDLDGNRKRQRNANNYQLALPLSDICTHRGAPWKTSERDGPGDRITRACAYGSRSTQRPCHGRARHNAVARPPPRA